MTRTGHCLCGAITFAYEGPENWRAHCHCESCRRQTASPVTTFMGVPNGNWRWTGREPALYVSSPGVRRLFCPICGAPVAYDSDAQPDEIHFYAALLDDHSNFAPEDHGFWNERVPWLNIVDDLPKHEGAASAESAPPGQS
jgi:hypothetical protein